MLIVGGIWARELDPECGETYESARFTIGPEQMGNSKYRVLNGNSCPGYSWKTSSPLTAGEYPFEINLPLSPIIAQQPTYVGKTNPIKGIIGYAVNGVPILGPATPSGGDIVIQESGDFDACGGHNNKPHEFSFNAPITGFYHYHIAPGTKVPGGPLCPAALTWYNETKGAHSPLAGFMADGIPIYGLNGAGGKPPTDLDHCGGHSSDKKFYHYHFKATFPYSVECLVGCTDGSMNPLLDNGGGNCVANKTLTAKNDYSSLKNLKISYGGYGVNHTNWTGPALLLVFGFMTFIPATICCICINCAQKREAKEETDRAGKDASFAHQLTYLGEVETLEEMDNIL